MGAEYSYLPVFSSELRCVGLFQLMCGRLDHSNLQSLPKAYQVLENIGPLGTMCMKIHMTSHHTAQWQEHQNANHLQENGHTPVPPPSSFFLSTSTPTMQDSLSVASSDKD